jgi:hypothetical protein
MDVRKRKLSEELSDQEHYSPSFGNKYSSANKTAPKAKHLKAETLTDSETDHESPVKKFQNFFDNNKPQMATFKSDFELAFDENDSISKNTSRGAFYSPNNHSTSSSAFNLSKEIQNTNESINKHRKVDDAENNGKSLKRSHEDASSMGGIGLKLMVLLKLQLTKFLIILITLYIY